MTDRINVEISEDLAGILLDGGVLESMQESARTELYRELEKGNDACIYHECLTYLTVYNLWEAINFARTQKLMAVKKELAELAKDEAKRNGVTDA